MDRDHVVPLLRGHFVQRGAFGDPRVSHEHVDPTRFLQQPACHRLDRHGVGDIGRQRPRPLAQGGDLADDLRQSRVESHVVDPHGSALAREGQGDTPADPMRRPCHQRDPAVKLPHAHASI